MIASYLLSSTLVPVLSVWLLRTGPRPEPAFFETAAVVRIAIASNGCSRVRWLVVGGYVVATVAF